MACTSSPTFMLINHNPRNKHHFPWPRQSTTLQAFYLNIPKFKSSTMVHSLAADVITHDEGTERIKRLQNGSDIRGVALKGEKGRTVDLTPPAVEAIAESFGEWLKATLRHDDKEGENDVKVSLGRDPRITGPVLSAAVFVGLARAGCVIFDLGLATTPACFMSNVLPAFSYHGSIMMTASHLPYTRNGLKIFKRRGGLTSLEVEEICDRVARKYANRQAKMSLALTNPPTKVDLMSAYAKHLRDIIKERVKYYCSVHATI